MGASEVSLLLAAYIAGSILGGPLAGHFAGRLGMPRLTMAALVLGVVIAASYPLLPWSIAVTATAYLLIGAAVNAVLVLVASELVNAANDDRTGTAGALSLMRAGQALGPSLGPALAGLVFVRVGLAPAFLSLCASMALGLILFVGYLRLRRPVVPAASLVHTGDGLPPS
jgi:MFS family permease